MTKNPSVKRPGKQPRKIFIEFGKPVPAILLKSVEGPRWPGLLPLFRKHEPTEEELRAHLDEFNAMVQVRLEAACEMTGLTVTEIINSGTFAAIKLLRLIFPALIPIPFGKGKIGRPKQWTSKHLKTALCFQRSLELRATGKGKLAAWRQAAKESFGNSTNETRDQRWTELRRDEWIRMIDKIADDGPDGIAYALGMAGDLVSIAKGPTK